MERGSVPDAERTIWGAFILSATAARGAERDSVVGEVSSRGGDRGMAVRTVCARVAFVPVHGENGLVTRWKGLRGFYVWSWLSILD